MSEQAYPPPGFIFFSLLYRSDLISDTDLISLLDNRLQSNRDIFFHSYFPMKRYYSKEMGPEELLKRFFYVCLSLKKREELLENKLWASSQEQTKFQIEKKRYVNIDVGLLTLENLQLATTKNFSHRIYIGDGIFGDLTLIYKGNGYQELEWSYPDYKHPEIKTYFHRIRKTLHKQLML